MRPNPSNATKTGVYWTQFPSAALTDQSGQPVDWADHRAAHRAVSRLFQLRLPGEQGERRAEAGILYRVDALGPEAEPTVLVQSLVPPELTPRQHRSTEVSERGWRMPVGASVTFRIAVNPIVRTTRHYTDAAKVAPTEWTNTPGRSSNPRGRTHRKQTAKVVPIADIEEWLQTKLGDALGQIQILNHARDRSASGPHCLVVDTIDAIATVTDSQRLSELRLAGVGRAKAYGCGLLTTAILR